MAKVIEGKKSELFFEMSEIVFKIRPAQPLRVLEIRALEDRLLAIRYMLPRS
jgi:hypothetical protein